MDAITWAILNAFGSVKSVATKPKTEGGLGMTDQEYRTKVASEAAASVKASVGRAIPWAKNVKWALLGLAAFYVFRITKK